MSEAVEARKLQKEQRQKMRKNLLIVCLLVGGITAVFSVGVGLFIYIGAQESDMATLYEVRGVVQGCRGRYHTTVVLSRRSVLAHWQTNFTCDSEGVGVAVGGQTIIMTECTLADFDDWMQGKEVDNIKKRPRN